MATRDPRRLESERKYRAANREKINAARRARYHADPERAKAEAAEWKRANAERVREYKRAYYAAHPEEYAAKVAWREANRDKQRAANKKWRNSNRESLKIDRWRRRAKGEITVADLRAMRDTCDGICAYCLQRCDALSIDHVVPLARGGTHSIDNLVHACLACNSRKWARTPLEYLLHFPVEVSLAH